MATSAPRRRFSKRSLGMFALAATAISATVLGVGCNRFGSCGPQEANGLRTNCSGNYGFMWNGASCIYTQACNCSGADCDSLYSSKDTCEAAHTHCVK